MINGQPISFNDRTCNDFCLVLGNPLNCDEVVVNNGFFEGDITDYWTLVSTASQSTSNPCVLTGDASMEIQQSINLDNGTYRAFYSFGIDTGTYTFDLGISAGLSSTTLESGTAADVVGTYDFTISSGSDPRTLSLYFGLSSSAVEVTLRYFFICRSDYNFDTSTFCFQIPMEASGSSLLSSTTIDFPDPDNAYHTGGHIGTGGAPVDSSYSCGLSLANVLDDVHNDTTAGEDGYYFFKYALTGVSITYGSYPDGRTGQIAIRYDVDGQTEYGTFSEANPSGGFVSSNYLTMTSGNALVAKTEGYYEDDGTGTCRLIYDVESLETDLFKMWYEETVSAASNTYYRLSFRLLNSTGCTVRVFDSSGTEIFSSSSDGIYFDKIFRTGTLPGAKTLDIRIEIDDFIDYESDQFWKGIIDQAYMYKVCKHVIYSETSSGTFIETSTTTHDTSSELVGTSYHQNVQHCIDYTTYSAGCYRTRLINGCDSSLYKIGNCISICANDKRYKRFSWTPSDLKLVGSNVLDYETYDYECYFYLQADLQDLTLEEERVNYERSDGYYSTPYVKQRGIEILQLWPMPIFLRRSVAAMMQGTFYIDGVAYQKISDDEYSPQFTGRYDTSMRIAVHRVGDFSITRSGDSSIGEGLWISSGEGWASEGYGWHT